MSAALALQAALVARLRGSAPLSALLGAEKVFDDVPQGTAPPYVALGGIATRAWDTQTSAGHEHDVTLDAWTRAAGRKPALDILAAIETALEPPPAPAGNTLVSLRIISREVRRGPGLDVYRGILRLRAVTEQA